MYIHTSVHMCVCWGFYVALVDTHQNSHRRRPKRPMYVWMHVCKDPTQLTTSHVIFESHSPMIWMTSWMECSETLYWEQHNAVFCIESSIPQGATVLKIQTQLYYSSVLSEAVSWEAWAPTLYATIHKMPFTPILCLYTNAKGVLSSCYYVCIMYSRQAPGVGCATGRVRSAMRCNCEFMNYVNQSFANLAPQR